MILDDLVKALKAGHLAGAFVDVYPEEPEANNDNWTANAELKSCENVILTPHVGV